ncbi:penicillin-binding protein 1C [Roseovarius nanhaiticus]|uniref:peptidoglycan glycosyltransferase n=1 Tax=Roseovarius nanhaiticus TaxID=573024 RepID=A0A1N7E950_9RHOB|nr:penicillin-binding protein 1C [Roseovarius nanhaiticus]SEK79328.1 penicillin-binding protein 1C [Roseovarius nanhaiticus]SIR84584.1 penicillin-binding protein 1C [Roseovarius nanhaiticus]
MRAHRWLLALGLTLAIGAGARDGLSAWVAAAPMPPLLTTTGAEVLDRDGRPLRIYTVADGRWRLAPGQVDPAFTDMLIAFEDQRFRSHAGIDPLAMLRAGAQAVRHGGIVSGASTLTMQVARLLEEGSTGQWAGKLRQIRLALALERRLSKQEILQIYLARAPYGGNIEGIRAATLAWFAKEPRRLTPAEAALLVALPQSPETRRPDRHPDAARAARDRVLDRMARQGVLSFEAAEAAKLDRVPVARRPFPALAPHLADRAVAEDASALRHDLTIDAALQAQLEALAARAVRGLPDPVSVAIVLADHRSGEILASVGSAGIGSGARQGYVDMTTALRSPGSTLKPVIYAMAFDRGLAHPQTLIDDAPARFGAYAPQNFDGYFRGEVTAADALRQSLNIPPVRLLDAMGPAHLMDVMRRAGLQPKLPGDHAGLAVALGGVGVSLTDMVQLYAALAQGGEAMPLRWRQGEDSAPQRILGRAAAWQVGDILAGLAPPANAPARALAYKTGTSYGHRDAWALGWDGAHVAGVWIGRPDGTPVPGAFGGDLAAPILFEAFQRLKSGFDPLPPPPPDTLTVGTAELPQPLRRFAGRGAAFDVARGAPELIFPPDGARMAAQGGLPVKVRGGTPPYTWMANGASMLTGVRAAQASLTGLGQGFSRISVIDAAGRSARVTVRLD